MRSIVFLVFTRAANQPIAPAYSGSGIHANAGEDPLYPPILSRGWGSTPSIGRSFHVRRALVDAICWKVPNFRQHGEHSQEKNLLCFFRTSPSLSLWAAAAAAGQSQVKTQNCCTAQQEGSLLSFRQRHHNHHRRLQAPRNSTRVVCPRQVYSHVLPVNAKQSCHVGCELVRPGVARCWYIFRRILSGPGFAVCIVRKS